jgi:hypothetical protein
VRFGHCVIGLLRVGSPELLTAHVLNSLGCLIQVWRAVGTRTWLHFRPDDGRGRTEFTLLSCQVAIDLDHFSAVVDHVQHQSAAGVAPLTDRPRPLTTSSTGQRPSATLLPQATDQKAGGSSLSERAHEFPGPRCGQSHS